MHPFASYCRWPSTSTSHPRGFIVGSDLAQEWLLPWWWDNYSRHNSFPVTFVDFGLSSEMRAWCQERGTLISLPIPNVFAKEKEELPEDVVRHWEQEFGRRVWDCRHAWFKKPLACLQSPYQTSVWIDTDCEVLGPLDSVFTFSVPPLGALVTPEVNNGNSNSGVIVFQRGSPLIERWAEEMFGGMEHYPGDEDALHIVKKDFPVHDLPFIYNWSRMREDNPQALILHWHGQHGKTVISHKIAKQNLRSLGLL